MASKRGGGPSQQQRDTLKRKRGVEEALDEFENLREKKLKKVKSMPEFPEPPAAYGVMDLEEAQIQQEEDELNESAAFVYNYMKKHGLMDLVEEMKRSGQIKAVSLEDVAERTRPRETPIETKEEKKGDEEEKNERKKRNREDEKAKMKEEEDKVAALVLSYVPPKLRTTAWGTFFDKIKPIDESGRKRLLGKLKEPEEKYNELSKEYEQIRSLFRLNEEKTQLVLDEEKKSYQKLLAELNIALTNPALTERDLIETQKLLPGQSRNFFALPLAKKVSVRRLEDKDKGVYEISDDEPPSFLVGLFVSSATTRYRFGTEQGKQHILTAESDEKKILTLYKEEAESKMKLIHESEDMLRSRMDALEKKLAAIRNQIIQDIPFANFVEPAYWKEVWPGCLWKASNSLFEWWFVSSHVLVSTIKFAKYLRVHQEDFYDEELKTDSKVEEARVLVTKESDLLPKYGEEPRQFFAEPLGYNIYVKVSPIYWNEGRWYVVAENESFINMRYFRWETDPVTNQTVFKEENTEKVLTLYQIPSQSREELEKTEMKSLYKNLSYENQHFWRSKTIQEIKEELDAFDTLTKTVNTVVSRITKVTNKTNNEYGIYAIQEAYKILAKPQRFKRNDPKGGIFMIKKGLTNFVVGSSYITLGESPSSFEHVTHAHIEFVGNVESFTQQIVSSAKESKTEGLCYNMMTQAFVLLVQFLNIHIVTLQNAAGGLGCTCYVRSATAAGFITLNTSTHLKALKIVKRIWNGDGEIKGKEFYHTHKCRTGEILRPTFVSERMYAHLLETKPLKGFMFHDLEQVGHIVNELKNSAQRNIHHEHKWKPKLFSALLPSIGSTSTQQVAQLLDMCLPEVKLGKQYRESEKKDIANQFLNLYKSLESNPHHIRARLLFWEFAEFLSNPNHKLSFANTVTLLIDMESTGYEPMVSSNLMTFIQTIVSWSLPLTFRPSYAPQEGDTTKRFSEDEQRLLSSYSVSLVELIECLPEKVEDKVDETRILEMNAQFHYGVQYQIITECLEKLAKALSLASSRPVTINQIVNNWDNFLGYPTMSSLFSPGRLSETKRLTIFVSQMAAVQTKSSNDIKTRENLLVLVKAYEQHIVKYKISEQDEKIRANMQQVAQDIDSSALEMNSIKAFLQQGIDKYGLSSLEPTKSYEIYSATRMDDGSYDYPINLSSDNSTSPPILSEPLQVLVDQGWIGQKLASHPFNNLFVSTTVSEFDRILKQIKKRFEFLKSALEFASSRQKMTPGHIILLLETIKRHIPRHSSHPMIKKILFYLCEAIINPRKCLPSNELSLTDFVQILNVSKHQTDVQFYEVHVAKKFCRFLFQYAGWSKERDLIMILSGARYFISTEELFIEIWKYRLQEKKIQFSTVYQEKKEDVKMLTAPARSSRFSVDVSTYQMPKSEGKTERKSDLSVKPKTSNKKKSKKKQLSDKELTQQLGSLFDY